MFCVASQVQKRIYFLKAINRLIIKIFKSKKHVSCIRSCCPVSCYRITIISCKKNSE